MTPASTGIREQRKAETTRRILAVAARLFADHGYDGTSMDQVAEEAGVGKGTIFYIFATKAALFEALVVQAAESFRDDLVAAREGRRGWAALIEAEQTIATRIDAHPHVAQILLVELIRRGRPWAQTTAAARETILEPLRGIMGEVAADRQAAGIAGHAATPAQIETVCVAVLGALALATLDRAAHQSDRALTDVISGLELALSGLQP